jgi:hypothetical protein
MSAVPRATVRQQPWLAPLLAVLVPVLFTVGILWYAANSLLAALCGSTEILRLTSPDGRHDAVLFEHNCGATTDFATHVSVLPAGAPLGNEAGNAFAAEAGHSGRRAAWGGPPVEVTWGADGRLAIRYDAEAEVFLTAEAVDGVRIQAELPP